MAQGIGRRHTMECAASDVRQNAAPCPLACGKRRTHSHTWAKGRVRVPVAVARRRFRPINAVHCTEAGRPSSACWTKGDAAREGANGASSRHIGRGRLGSVRSARVLLTDLPPRLWCQGRIAARRDIVDVTRRLRARRGNGPGIALHQNSLCTARGATQPRSSRRSASSQAGQSSSDKNRRR